MMVRKSVRYAWVVVVWALSVPPAPAEPAPGRGPYRVAERSSPTPSPPAIQITPAQPNEHPLMPALRWAYEGKRRLEQIRDYTAVMAKRERIDGTIGPYEYMFVKIRQRPFSVYLCFLDPPSLKGQEVIYVAGQNDGKMWAHGVGVRRIFGTVSLDPNGLIAMRGNHYPITEIGISNLVHRLIEVGERDAQYGECEVKFIPGAKVNGRQCTCLQVVHPVPRRNFLFHLARIYADDELQVPLRYEAHDWPRTPGGEPELMEEYTYQNLKLNVGLTDRDFDIRNPEYGFQAR